MNLLDAFVKEIIGEPEFKYNKWFIKVSYTCWSDKVEEKQLMFNTKEECLAVKPGHMFLT